MTGGRRPRRGAGDGRAHAALARAPRRAARARGRRDRAPARRAGRGGRRRADDARLLLATRNAHKLREFARLAGPHAIDPLPDDVELPPEDGATFAENALGKARAAAAATGRVGDRRRLGHRGGRARRPARDPLGALRRRARERRREPRQAAARGAGRQPARLRLRARLRRPGQRRGARSSRSAAPARSRPTRAASGGFGYDPAFLPDDGAPRPHDGRAERRREGRDQPPRPRRARAARLAAGLSAMAAAATARARTRRASGARRRCRSPRTSR